MVADNWTIAQSLANIAAVIVAVPSIVFAARQAAISAKAASASALAAISTMSRELQWKVLENPILQPILSSSQAEFSDEMKREAVRGMLFNFYAFVYEFRKLDQIPDTSWQAYKSDMTDFFTQAPNRERWNKLRAVFPGEFQDFIEHEILNRPR